MAKQNEDITEPYRTIVRKAYSRKDNRKNDGREKEERKAKDSIEDRNWDHSGKSKRKTEKHGRK